MAQYLRIRCVVKTDRTSAHERIQSVGVVKPDGSRCKLYRSLRSFKDFSAAESAICSS